MSLQEKVGKGFYRLGSSGPVVADIQHALAGLGYSLKGTAYFGPATDTAVSAFQKRAGIMVDGVVGPATARAIDAAGASPDIPAPPEEVSRPLWLEAGIKLIGTKEFAGARDNPVIIDWAKDEGGMIAREYTHDVVPWCALFGNHILTKVGLKGTETLWALDFAGKWPAINFGAPVVGAFAPMLRDGGGHIMCVVGRDRHGNVMGLGGNQSDAVSIVPFPTSRLNKGFWWPNGVSVPRWVGHDTLPLVTSNGRVSYAEA